jgi:hypothetical protein
MPSVNWNRVHDDDFRVPTDRSLADLTAELTGLLGDVDPQQRDRLAYPVLATWIERGVYDDLLPGLGDGMAAGLGVGLGELEGDLVFRRSFSALILGEVIARDAIQPLVPGGKVLEWGDRIATWFLAERDLRGYVPGKGWAHAIAHGADALGTLSGSPHTSIGELTVILDVIGERVMMPADRVFHSGEPDRLALATMQVLRRNRVPFDIIEPWVERLGEHASSRPRRRDVDPYLHGGNADAFLRALYFQLAFSPHPPEVRGDVLLLVVDALKNAHPHYLGAVQPAH